MQKHWRERQRSQNHLWLSQGKTVKEIDPVLHGCLKEETIRTHPQKLGIRPKIEGIWQSVWTSREYYKLYIRHRFEVD